MSIPLYLECTQCQHQQVYEPLELPTCEKCGANWLEPVYDYALFKRQVLRGLPGRLFNMWRYHEVLPVNDPFALNLDYVGGTPLVPARRFAAELLGTRVFIKDERYGPTSSFKDRQAALSAAAMLEAGVRESVIASTGNAAVAYAAACARAGIKLWVFMTSLVPSEKLRETALFGAEVIKVSGTYDQTKQIAAEFARRRGLLLDRGAHSIPARESMKTLAYEIAEQLGWQAPDWYVQSVSGGLGPLGVYHGFMELIRMGLVDRIPKVAVIQTEGCAPMVRAFKAGKYTADPVIPQTLIAILSTGDPGKTYTYLWKLINQYGGVMESVSDSEAFTVMHSLAKSEGMAVEPAAAVAFAGYEKLRRQGIIGADELVVINCSGHTFPVEKHVLGDQWKVDISLGGAAPTAPKEGLVAALESLDEKTTTVLIIEDNPDDALLIRRFLESRKAYRVFHAESGMEGLKQARQRLPDLIVLDMMMPEVDGFQVLKELKQEEATSRIPVIIVSAKDVTRSELEAVGGVEGIYQKSNLPVQTFLKQVTEVLEQKRRMEEE
jgi:threonine synthase